MPPGAAGPETGGMIDPRRRILQLGRMFRRDHDDSLPDGPQPQLGDLRKQGFKARGLLRGSVQPRLQIAILSGRCIGLLRLDRKKLIELDTRVAQLRSIAGALRATRKQLDTLLAQRPQPPRQVLGGLVDARKRCAEQHCAARGAQRVVGTKRDDRRQIRLQPLQHGEQTGDLAAVARKIGCHAALFGNEPREFGVDAALFLLERLHPGCGIDQPGAQVRGLRVQQGTALACGFDRRPVPVDLRAKCMILRRRAGQFRRIAHGHRPGQIFERFELRFRRMRPDKGGRGFGCAMVTRIRRRIRTRSNREDGKDRVPAVKRVRQAMRSGLAATASIREWPDICGGGISPIKARSVGATSASAPWDSAIGLRAFTAMIGTSKVVCAV